MSTISMKPTWPPRNAATVADTDPMGPSTATRRTNRLDRTAARNSSRVANSIAIHVTTILSGQKVS